MLVYVLFVINECFSFESFLNCFQNLYEDLFRRLNLPIKIYVKQLCVNLAHYED